jgi:hypothetical protein
MADEVLESMVEIHPLSSSNFLKLRETLTRMGYSDDEGSLFQTCFVLHKRGRYFLAHFRELRALDGHPFKFTQEERDHRDRIISLILQWKGLGVRPVRPFDSERVAGVKDVVVIHFDDKNNWTLCPRYKIGRK